MDHHHLLSFVVWFRLVFICRLVGDKFLLNRLKHLLGLFRRKSSTSLWTNPSWILCYISNRNLKENSNILINLKPIWGKGYSRTLTLEEEVGFLILNGTVLIIILRSRLTIYAIMKWLPHLLNIAKYFIVSLMF